MDKPLSPSQQIIVEQQGNMIVRASAGTGKTHTMVAKIEYDIDYYKSHKVIAALTFTIKAASEIRDRLSIATDDHFVGTNNSFAIEEIIKPFMKDAFGPEYDVDMSTDYNNKVDDYDAAVEAIQDKGIIHSYNNSKENFVFQLALNIVKESFACREYLKAKYLKIYVDEYQDCDKDMHNFFMYIADVLSIDLFVVGDEKQSIYMWRGAYPEAFRSIWDKANFKHEYLKENFRSSVAIQNYSNLLCEETRDRYVPITDVSPVVFLCSRSDGWTKIISGLLNQNKRTAVLRYKHADAEAAAISLSEGDMTFTYIRQPLISEITTNSAWLYQAIANYLIVDTFSVYDFIQIIPEQSDESKKLITDLKKMLKSIECSMKKNDKDSFSNCVIAIADYFGYETRADHITQLYETVSDEKYRNFFIQDSIQNISMNFFASKGLEFDQVIIFAEDYPMNDLSSINNHYVASTRAKEKLIIVYCYGPKDSMFVKKLLSIYNQIGIKARDVMTIIEDSETVTTH